MKETSKHLIDSIGYKVSTKFDKIHTIIGSNKQNAEIKLNITYKGRN